MKSVDDEFAKLLFPINFFNYEFPTKVMTWMVFVFCSSIINDYINGECYTSSRTYSLPCDASIPTFAIISVIVIIYMLISLSDSVQNIVKRLKEDSIKYLVMILITCASLMSFNFHYLVFIFGYLVWVYILINLIHKPIVSRFIETMQSYGFKSTSWFSPYNLIKKTSSYTLSISTAKKPRLSTISRNGSSAEIVGTHYLLRVKDHLNLPKSLVYKLNSDEIISLGDDACYWEEMNSFDFESIIDEVGNMSLESSK